MNTYDLFQIINITPLGYFTDTKKGDTVYLFFNAHTLEIVQIKARYKKMDFLTHFHPLPYWQTISEDLPPAKHVERELQHCAYQLGHLSPKIRHQLTTFSFTPLLEQPIAIKKQVGYLLRLLAHQPLTKNGFYHYQMFEHEKIEDFLTLSKSVFHLGKCVAIPRTTLVTFQQQLLTVLP